MQRIKCIYCLEDKSSQQYQKREHVIPQCFGKFTPDNLILYETVCDDCNQYFGDNVELYLGRDTVEGIIRYRHGIKPRKFPSKHTRIKTKIAEGKLKGVIVLQKPPTIDGDFDIEPVLQVGFLQVDKKEYDYFEPHEIPMSKELEEKGYDIKGKDKISVYAQPGEEMEYLLRTLKEKGIKCELRKQTKLSEMVKEGEKVLVEGRITIDPIIYRGISKIVFNYLAYKEGKEFVLVEDFDDIRRFIRYGKGNYQDYFGVNEPPILHHDRLLKQYNLTVTNGHLIVIEWKGKSLIGKVSIFNMKTYLIKLCRYYEGIWRPIHYGHHFDIGSKEISKLVSMPRRLMP